MKTITVLLLLTLFIGVSSCMDLNHSGDNGEEVTFVSFPDFFNFDIPEPWPQYDDAVNYFLDEVAKEKPTYVLVAGDLVDGHWWDGPSCVEHCGATYYNNWIRRMKQHNLTYYTAVGDHELGDDPWPPEKLALVVDFERVYAANMKMPQNGPGALKGLAYYVREGDLLMITVETFEVKDTLMHASVTGAQLEWLKKVFADNKDAKFKVVQGHVPIWGEIKVRSSSMIMLEGGKDSDFYQVMKENGVDAYLAGEFHDVTVLESDGLWQIVHGSSWGRKIVNTQDYLVANCVGDEMNLTLKRIYMDAKGEKIWNVNKPNGPRERVDINERTLKNGPEVTGTLTIVKKDGVKEYKNKTGYFDAK